MTENEKTFQLETIEGLAQFFFDHKTNAYLSNVNKIAIKDIYCPECGDRRRVKFTWLYNPVVVTVPIASYFDIINAFDLSTADAPSLLNFTCVQCQTIFIELIYHGYDGKAHLIVLPRVAGGLSTPHTPKAVTYYLDEAYKSQSIGANSAAVAMYRSALEHLLYEQGYTVDMLGTKIKRLEADILAGTAKQWAMELDTEYLNVIKNLGNGAIHVNDGNVRRQSALDTNLLAVLGETFRALLWLIYEVPYEKSTYLAKLQVKVKMLTK